MIAEAFIRDFTVICIKYFDYSSVLDKKLELHLRFEFKFLCTLDVYPRQISFASELIVADNIWL